MLILIWKGKILEDKKYKTGEFSKNYDLFKALSENI